MNKAELIQKYHALVAELGVDASDIVIGAGGALLMLRLRQETQDLDADIPLSLYTKLAESGSYTMKTNCVYPDDLLIIQYSEDIDLHAMRHDREVVQVDGVWIYSLNQVYQQKLAMNRPKDQADIANIKAVMRDSSSAALAIMRGPTKLRS